MGIEQEPFRKYNEGESTDTFTIRLNPEERKLLEECKKILEQKKDSTAFKQLAWIGSDVLHDQKTSKLLGYLFKNKRNNERQNIADYT